MDEKVLIQYRCADDANYKKIKLKVMIIMIISIILGVALIAVADSLNTEMGTNFVRIYGVIAIIAFPVIYIVISVYGKESITVTSNRVYGRTFKDELNLPMDSITSINKTNSRQNSWYALSFASSSGRVKFAFATEAKRDEVYQIVNEQLVNRQNNKGSVVVMNQTSTPDDLKKYKELLESGIITQEEFDAKKKQLLGL